MRSLFRLFGMLLLLAPLPARAQFMDVVSGLFDSVNAIVFYGQVGALTNNEDIEGTVANLGTAGLGAEVLIDLPSVGNTYFELGLGTSLTRGFDAAEPSLDLRGSLRTLPTIAVYASQLGLPDDSPILPYVGAGFGFSELWNARGYTEDGTIIPVDADTYEFGASAGFYVNAGPFRGFYTEAGYRQRNFESLIWDTDQLPAGWPRSIDASGFELKVGWQFVIEDSYAEDETE
ncbi:MAG: hypothetical protein HKN04_07475 [Rhodothermaceae bacterium]|nr:hypothetical protein [Rhodothermaceae bacterium]